MNEYIITYRKDDGSEGSLKYVSKDAIEAMNFGILVFKINYIKTTLLDGTNPFKDTNSFDEYDWWID